jgi:hypothetical protein
MKVPTRRHPGAGSMIPHLVFVAVYETACLPADGADLPRRANWRLQSRFDGKASARVCVWGRVARLLQELLQKTRRAADRSPF